MFSLCEDSLMYKQCGKKSEKPSTNEAQVSMIKGYREKIEQELARICEDTHPSRSCPQLLHF
jgi:hypothetical protein